MKARAQRTSRRPLLSLSLLLVAGRTPAESQWLFCFHKATTHNLFSSNRATFSSAVAFISLSYTILQEETWPLLIYFLDSFQFGRRREKLLCLVSPPSLESIITKQGMSLFFFFLLGKKSTKAAAAYSTAHW